MVEDGKDTTSVVTPLNAKQTESVLGNLKNQGATFFTWETLQYWLKIFGPNAKVQEVQKALANQEGQPLQGKSKPTSKTIPATEKPIQPEKGNNQTSI